MYTLRQIREIFLHVTFLANEISSPSNNFLNPTNKHAIFQKYKSIQTTMTCEREYDCENILEEIRNAMMSCDIVLLLFLLYYTSSDAVSIGDR